jgi:hypothetical protein
MKAGPEKHRLNLPSARVVRRACRRELYRTVKRLGRHVPDDLFRQAETLYVRKVVDHLPWIVEHREDRRRLADWWEERVSGEIAALWNVDRRRLADAFRDAFGG